MVTLKIAKVTSSTETDSRLAANVEQLKTVRMCSTINDSIPDTVLLIISSTCYLEEKLLLAKCMQKLKFQSCARKLSFSTMRAHFSCPR